MLKLLNHALLCRPFFSASILFGLTVAQSIAATERIDLVSAFRQGLTNDPVFLSAGAANRAAQKLIPQVEAELLPNV